MRTLTLSLVVLLLTTTHAQTPPVRDVRPPATGTAVISGVVITEEQEPRPIRRARVTARAPELPQGMTVVTDDRGAFSLSALPAARYMLTIEKDGFPGLAYGAKRPGRPGTSLVLAEGQQVTGLTIRMPRGSVITGTVLDQNGQPAVGASVRAMRYTFISGGRRLTPAGNMSGTADDRGIYRIYGLPAGEYAVSATATRLGPFDVGATTITTAADITRARQDLKTQGPQAAPGDRTSANAAGAPRPAAVAYSPVYYPGTAVAEQATLIPIAPGEERTGIDFQLSLTPTARIDGTVSVPDGITPQTVAVSIVTLGDEATLSPFEGMRTARLDSSGRFTFASIKPGRYVISARASPPGAKPATSTADMFTVGALFGMTEVSIDGNDLANVTVDLQPGGTVSGRLVFETANPESVPDVSRIRVTLNAVQAPGEVSFGASPGTVDKSGAFTITGASPGRYRVTPVSIPNAPKWAVKSSMLDGRDTLDVPVEIRPLQNVEGVVVTITDSPTELTGVVRDAAGQAAADYVVIAFAENRAFWTPQSRRIQGVRPSQDGKYTMRNLPPGEYIVVAVADVEPGEWFDPSFLQRVAPSGMRLTIADGDKKTQDLQIK
jgi:uncharacterized protein (DUF2141 family)